MQEVWDEFVKDSRNGTFLFMRGYMDYHADRFRDHSLMYYGGKGQLLAILPANEVKEEDGSMSLCSHGGLTYGGFVLAYKTTMEDVLDIMELTLTHLKENGFSTFYYKQVPTIYHRCPSQEDEYALWKYGAELTVCNISSALPFYDECHGAPIEMRRRRGFSRAEKLGYEVDVTRDLTRFWEIMEQNLRERYNTSPVHTKEEMELLMGRFPENIECFVARKEGQVEAGVILYTYGTVAHAQYIQSSPTGRKDGALDFLIFSIINDLTLLGCHYLDLGISNEDYGRKLNTNLIAQKEGFGARGVAYKQWKLSI